MRSGSTRDRGVASSSLTCVTALSKHTVHIGVAPHPLKNHKHIEFLSNTGPDFLKSIKPLSSLYNGNGPQIEALIVLCKKDICYNPIVT